MYGHLVCTDVGVLTSLPLFAFAAFSPVSATVAKWFGLERTIIGALMLIALGIALRSTGVVGLVFVPGLAAVWAALLGFGSGASMILGLKFIGLRTHSAAQAVALLGMAQCVGYLMAAAGPMLLGVIRDWQGGWTVPLILAAGVAILGAWAGMLGGRNIHIGN